MPDGIRAFLWALLSINLRNLDISIYICLCAHINNYESRILSTSIGGQRCVVKCGVDLVSQSVVVAADLFCWAEFDSVGIHRILSTDDHWVQAGMV
jgi:hypothetical protein